MIMKNLAWTAAFALCLALPAAADAVKQPHVPGQKTIGQPASQGMVPSLAVLNAKGATLADGKLTLTGVLPNSIVFADRPFRAAGHVNTGHFIGQWDEGKDSFAKDPPNATISVLGANGTDVSDAVVTLRTPKLDGGNLTFDVTVLEGSLDGATGSAALFIDHYGSSFAVDSVNGGDPFGDYYVDPRLNGAWYQPNDNFGNKYYQPACSEFSDPPCQ
jgi:hypothetical protein